MRWFEDTGQYRREPSGETVCRARKACFQRSGSKEVRLNRKPDWLRWASEFVMPQLRDFPLDYIDRKSVQSVFNVSRSEAHRILRSVNSVDLSGRRLVHKDTLMEWIKTCVETDEAQYEIKRVERIDEMLKTIRRNAAGSRIRVPAAADVRSRLLRDLPGGIELHPGELRVSFFGAEDLAAKLFELSQAMANDWRNFEAAVEDKL